MSSSHRWKNKNYRRRSRFFGSIETKSDPTRIAAGKDIDKKGLFTAAFGGKANEPKPRRGFWMTEGRDKHVWSVVSAVMALVANCHKDSKSRALRPDDFNPTLTRKERRRNAILITDDNVGVMRDEFKKVFQ